MSITLTEAGAPRLLKGVLLLGAGVIFWNLWGGSLKSWDETLTAERAREILVFQDWLTIRWNYEPDFIKPPLYYWLTAVLYRLVGINEFAARFWSAAFGVLGLYAVYRLGTLLFSTRLGVVAAALFLTVTSYLNYARAAMLDTGLFSFGVLALCAFLAWAPLRGWLFLGIGFMLKGPWIFFYALPLPLWWWTHRRWEQLKDTKLYLGFGIFLAIVLPWHVAQYLLHGQAFLDSYVGYQMLARIQEPLEGHSQELLFYLKRLSDKWHVWFYWLIIGHFVVDWRGGDRKALILLDVWLVVALAILTFVIETQITRYAMTVYAPVALLVAYYILYALEQLRWGKPLLVVSGIISLMLFFYLYNGLIRTSEIEELGQIVRSRAPEAQTVAAHVDLLPAAVFYCRRPIRWIKNAAELTQAVRDRLFVIAPNALVAASAGEGQGFTERIVSAGPTYALIAPDPSLAFTTGLPPLLE
jgi:4-amino-4-deoxy-L-arabinose transferase-like glycosyltransferase